MSHYPANIPLRSRLYSLQPLGMGTPWVESLTGYVARLAEKHSTTLYYLFSEEVAPLIEKPGTIDHRVSFASFAKAVCGLGVTAADLVEVFERLTLRRDLRVTTMLPWAGAISSKNLTRKWRAWCPACYAESATGRVKLYDQLLWSVQCVTACVRHECRLVHECIRCGRRQLPLSHRIRPGFCGRCDGWLGGSPGGRNQVRAFGPGEPTADELRLAEAVGTMLAAAPVFPLRASSGFRAKLRPHVAHLFAGRGVPSSFSLPAGRLTVRCWLRGTQVPSLPLLLRTCRALKISPLDLLVDDEDDKPGGATDAAAFPASSRTCPDEGGADTLPVDWKDSESLTRVENRLRAALEEEPPSSLTKIAGELRCTRATLRKKFPALATRLARRAEIHYRTSADTERVSGILRAALNEEPPPSLQEVSRRIGKGASTTTLHKRFPEESREIVEKYRAAKKRRLDDKAIEKKLRAALERDPPPSTPELSREVGVASATLYRKFPELFRRISNRFAVFRRQRDARNKEQARAEIKAICECSLREGVYPSDALVRSRLSVPCQSATISEIRRGVLAGPHLTRSPFLLIKAQPVERHKFRG